MLNWLLVFVPVAVALEFLHPDAHAWIFLSSCLAIIPLAGWLGSATEAVAAKSGDAVGGLLNATFGNAAELIIALMALQRGLYPVVKASLTGSILGNMLLVLGASMLAGGMRYPAQTFNALSARSQATLLTLASISLIVPAAFHYLAGRAAVAKEFDLSTQIAVVLLIVYALSLVFSLYTHRRLMASSAEPEPGHAPWPMSRALSILAISTAAIAWMSEILVGSVEQAAHTFGMTSTFTGVIIVAIVGNAAEHSSAILMARKNRMDLTLGIALGSSLQIAMFVAPLLVLASRVLGPGHMDLVFSPAEVLAIGLAVAIAGQVSGDGESNWLEGALLLAVYLILALVFYWLPETA